MDVEVRFTLSFSIDLSIRFWVVSWYYPISLAIGVSESYHLEESLLVKVCFVLRLDEIGILTRLAKVCVEENRLFSIRFQGL